MMKTMIIGANGALGTDLMQQIENPIACTHADLDITSFDEVDKLLAAVKPTHVVNTAAYHNVPACEDHYQQAFEVNAIGARNLAIACKNRRIHLCHLSTDYVFDGRTKKPYTESDLPAPLSTYAITKLAGEHMVQAYGSKDASIVRSCGLYGAVPTRAKGGNFVTTMVHLGRTRDRVTVVNDEWVAPTYTLDLARAIGLLLSSKGKGIFHITQSGRASWFEFARVIFDELRLPAKLEPIAAYDFQSKVQRPAFSVLDNSRFNQLTGEPMRHWEEALRDHLRDMVARGIFSR
ncbi:MAG: dTDP-4-dehydrorhamnose reductase [Acidobacteria bacterium]|nr:dTDP-4-dehydrorhamnose reductase [Acidobacteriota bacterium]